MMPRFFASSRLMASTPTPKLEMISSLGSASISLPSTGVGPKVASPRTVCACCFRKAARSAASNSLWQVNSFCSVAMVPAWPCAVRMISAFIVSGLEFGGERFGAAREYADVGPDSHEQSAALEPVASVGFVGGQDSRRLARFANAPHRFVDERLHPRIGCFTRMAERGVQVGRPDEHAVDAVDSADGLDIVERLLRFDLHQQADFVVRALGVVLDPAEARGAGGARDATHAGGRVTRIGHCMTCLSRRGNIGDEQRMLDIGAQSLLVPYVSTPAEAK